MRNAEYWRGRALILEEAAHRRAEETTAGLNEIYDEAMRETQKELEVWYARLAKNNNLTLADAKKLLTKNELDEFHWDVEKYIKVGEDHGLEPDWMKKLENASAKFHISRLEAVEVKIQQQIERLHAGQVGRLDKHLRQVAGETYLRTAYEVQKGIGIAFDITALDEKKLDTFISNPWSTDDRTFRDRCWTMKENLVESVRKNLIKGLIRGDAPRKLTEEIQKEFNVSKYKAGRLVNTETAYFAMQSTKQCYKDINVDMVEIVGTLDSHTCDLCGSFDGKVIRMSDFEPGETVPPWHPNCRCCTAPYIPDEDKGTRVARGADGKQYEVPGDMTFDEWKGKFVGEGVDKSEKRDIIEAERKAALEKIGTDELPLKINAGNQNKHIRTSHSFNPADNKSVFYGSLEQAQKLVDAYHGKGEFRFTKAGKWTNKEIITLEKEVGITFNEAVNEWKKTNRFAIHYGKKGTHIVPIEPLEKEDKR